MLNTISKPNTLSKIVKNKTDSLSIQFFRYSFVGGIAFIVDFGSLFALTEFASLHYLLSAAIAFLLGLTINYTLSILWVFSKRRFPNRSFEFGIFALIGIVGLGFNELFIWFFTEFVHLHYLLSKIVSTVFVYLWNFFARRYTLFR